MLIVESAPGSVRERVRRWSELFPESCEECLLYSLAEDVARARR